MWWQGSPWTTGRQHLKSLQNITMTPMERNPTRDTTVSISTFGLQIRQTWTPEQCSSASNTMSTALNFGTIMGSGTTRLSLQKRGRKMKNGIVQMLGLVLDIHFHALELQLAPRRLVLTRSLALSYSILPNHTYLPMNSKLPSHRCSYRPLLQTIWYLIPLRADISQLHRRLQNAMTL